MRNVCISSFVLGKGAPRFFGPGDIMFGPNSTDQDMFSLICNGPKRCAVYYLRWIDFQDGAGLAVVSTVYRLLNVTDSGVSATQKDTLSPAGTATARNGAGPLTYTREPHPLLVMGSRNVNTQGACLISTWRAWDDHDAIILQPQQGLVFVNPFQSDTDLGLCVNIHWAELPNA